MEKSQVKGIESFFYTSTNFIVKYRCMEKSQVKGIESSVTINIVGLLYPRCMEKSQVKGIERRNLFFTNILLKL